MLHACGFTLFLMCKYNGREQQTYLVVCAAKEERVKAQQARKQRRLRGGMPERVHLWPMLHQPQPHTQNILGVSEYHSCS